MAPTGGFKTDYREDMERLSRLKFDAQSFERSTLAQYNADLEKLTSANQLIIAYGKAADRSMLTDFSYELVRRWMLRAGVNSLVITSISRDAAGQAREMYQNLQTGKSISYRPPGERVADVFRANKSKGQTDVLRLMESEINKEGLTNVTSHGEDKAWVNTIDIGPSSLSPGGSRAAFRRAVESEVGHVVRKFLHPGNSKDPAYHIEIKQGIYRALRETTTNI